MKIVTKPAHLAWVLCGVFLLELKVTYGHGEHDEASHSSPSPALPASERPFVIGSSFEVVLIACDKNKALLYIADRETNQPINKATILIQGSGSPNLKVEASRTEKEGEYSFVHEIKEGEKVDIKIDIKEETRSETLSTLIPQWPATSGQCKEKGHV